jgi:serine/threonine protein kinase
MKSEDWQRLKEVFNTIVDLPESERAAVLKKYDKNIRFEVEKLINANEEAEDFILEPAFVEVGFSEEDKTDFYVGKQIDSYKILEEIGQGGMGTVYLAVRSDDFEKRVALKLIKRGMDTNSVLKRFVMERQILARLEHPNIANLLDGGSTTDGLPYLVMEYVEGLPVTKFCASEDLNIEARLALFQKICTAVSFAHQNLVVHRDIKPSNILVTPDGTPKLLDFGIAKLLHPDWSLDTAEATATAFRVMTPDYASPEQILGLPITTTADVYSLGVVLYELLTGERPYKIESRSPEEIAKFVLTEEPLKPSDCGLRIAERGLKKISEDTDENQNLKTDHQEKIRNPQSAIRNLRGDLDNIILKALRKEPERRYQSVQEFAEDIRRHLEGLPVTAMADTVSYRIAKFAKRHKVGVLVSILMLLTILLATTITTWQAIVAKREQAKTQQRFNQVRKLANTILFEYHDDVAKLSGSTPLREKMVKNALEYLDNLSAENLDDKELQIELADAYEKVGNVQGNPYSANLGNQNGALESYQKALAIRQKLFSEYPSENKIKYEVGFGYNNIGDILWDKGDNEESLSNYRQGLQFFEELTQTDSQNPNYFTGMHASLNGIAHVQEQMGDAKGALETYRRGLKSAETTVGIEPTIPNRYSVAAAHLKIGDILMDVADFQSALESYNKGVMALSELVSADKDNVYWIRVLALGYNRIALVSTKLGQFAQSAEFNLKAVDKQKQIAAADPNNVQIHFDIAATYQNLGDNYLKMKKLEPAIENIQLAIKIYTETLAKNPDSSQPQAYLGGAYITYAEIFALKGNSKAALENYQNALMLLEADSIRGGQIKTLANAYQGIGGIHQKANRFPEAKIWYQKSFDIWNDLRDKGKLTSDVSTKPDEIKSLIENCDTKLK